jgi:hypothetical protein
LSAIDAAIDTGFNLHSMRAWTGLGGISGTDWSNFLHNYQGEAFEVTFRIEFQESGHARSSRTSFTTLRFYNIPMSTTHNVFQQSICAAAHSTFTQHPILGQHIFLGDPIVLIHIEERCCSTQGHLGLRAGYCRTLPNLQVMNTGFLHRCRTTCIIFPITEISKATVGRRCFRTV